MPNPDSKNPRVYSGSIKQDSTNAALFSISRQQLVEGEVAITELGPPLAFRPPHGMPAIRFAVSQDAFGEPDPCPPVPPTKNGRAAGEINRFKFGVQIGPADSMT